MTLTQIQMFELERRKIAALNETFMELVNHPTNPITREDLETLIAKRPERYSRFAGFLDKLPSAKADDFAITLSKAELDHVLGAIELMRDVDAENGRDDDAEFARALVAKIQAQMNR